MKSREPAITAPTGAPSPLGEIDPGRIPSRRHVARADAGGDAGVQQPRAVHVGGESVGFCDFHDLVESGFLPDRAAADIGGLLDADHGLRRLVAAARVKRCAKGVGRELSVGARQRRDLESAERGMGAAFAGDDMRGLMRQNFVAGPAMHQRRRDVAHGAGGHEHGGLLAEQIGDALAQQIDGRIVADLLVADLGPRDRLAHGRRRAGLGVRQQVDADRRRFGIARGRGVGHGGSLQPVCRHGRASSGNPHPRPGHRRPSDRDKRPGSVTKKKAPAKPGPSISETPMTKISANRIRRSDAAPSAPRTARRTDAGCGRTSPSSWSDRPRGSRARRARRAGWLPERR